MTHEISNKMRPHRPDDGPTRHEWECVGCGCFNDEDEYPERCWSCDYHIDGTSPQRDTEEHQ